MLDETRAAVVSTLPGWQAHPWLWAVGVLGLLAASIGVLAAVDRPMPRSRQALLGIALANAVVVGVSALRPPSPGDFPGGMRVAELRSLAQRLPDDVSLLLETSVAGGVWVALAAIALLLLATMALRFR